MGLQTDLWHFCVVFSPAFILSVCLFSSLHLIGNNNSQNEDHVVLRPLLCFIRKMFAEVKDQRTLKSFSYRKTFKQDIFMKPHECFYSCALWLRPGCPLDLALLLPYILHVLSFQKCILSQHLPINNVHQVPRLVKSYTRSKSEYQFLKVLMLLEYYFPVSDTAKDWSLVMLIVHWGDLK